MKPKLFKIGRPPKLTRNLAMVALAYEGKMTLTAIAKQYDVHISRASRIISKYWPVYIENKQKEGK